MQESQVIIADDVITKFTSKDDYNPTSGVLRSAIAQPSIETPEQIQARAKAMLANAKISGKNISSHGGTKLSEEQLIKYFKAQKKEKISDMLKAKTKAKNRAKAKLAEASKKKNRKK